MKRLVALLLAAAVCAPATLLAQDSEASEEYALEQARLKYQSATQSTTIATEQGTTVVVTVIEAPPSVQQEGQADDSDERRPYTPFLLSIVPGVTAPFGLWDSSVAVGAIGNICGSVYGLSAAGVFNIAAGTVAGLQAASVFNIAEDAANGLQAAGVFNIAGQVSMAQAAGVFNIAESVAGVQAAGIFNISDEVDGAQLAGVFNIAEEADGVMAAGVINIAGKARGVMIAPINIADELDGVAIGLLNFIEKGIHDVALDYQFDTETAYATYRSGTPTAYAVVYAGQPAAKTFTGTENITFGAGLGHRVRLLFLSADLEACVEMPLKPEDLGAAMQNGDPGRMPWNDAFCSFRVSFGGGRRNGFGFYMGFKTDLAWAGSGLVPAHLRAAFGSSSPKVIPLFGESLELWPKFFMGVKF